ncbi:hypothetical protein ScalyP_jg7195 [Parmales sp. scaly parma]|nr:hypothetical protein ScalyP_jg7195 [Parmales sp. scaly parma]
MLDIIRELGAGAIANSIASLLLNPCDVVKIRLQTQGQNGLPTLYQSTLHTAKTIVRQEGVFALHGGLWFPGLAASMLREASYSSFRFGLYTPVKKFYGADVNDSMILKIAAGATSGGLGSLLAVPTDVVKIRFQGEAGSVNPATGLYTTGLHKGKSPMYKNTLSAFVEMFRAGGLKGMWVGWQPTMMRAAALSSAQLSTYDQSKHAIKKAGLMDDGFPLHMVASLLAGGSTLIATQPFDTIKSRVMCAKVGEAGVLRAVYKTYALDGVRGFYRGSLASYARFGPHFIIALPLWEWTRKNIFGLGFV